MQPLCCLADPNSKVDFNGGNPKSAKCYCCTQRQELIKRAHKGGKKTKTSHPRVAGEKEEKKRRRENKEMKTHPAVSQRKWSSNIKVSKNFFFFFFINTWSFEMRWALDRLDRSAVPLQWSNRTWHLHSQGTGEMWNHLYHLALVSATLAFKIMSFCRQVRWNELHFAHCTAEAFHKQK